MLFKYKYLANIPLWQRVRVGRRGRRRGRGRRGSGHRPPGRVVAAPDQEVLALCGRELEGGAVGEGAHNLAEVARERFDAVEGGDDGEGDVAEGVHLLAQEEVALEVGVAEVVLDLVADELFGVLLGGRRGVEEVLVVGHLHHGVVHGWVVT